MNETSNTPATEPTPSLWQRFRPRKGHTQRSALYWIGVAFLGTTAMLLVTWIASAALAKKGSEKLLRVDLLLPKLKSIYRERKAEAFRTSEPETSELAHPKDWKAPVLPLPSVIDHPKATIVETPRPNDGPEPPRLALAEDIPTWGPGRASYEFIGPALVTCDEPVVLLNPCSPHRGDSPMIRNWKYLSIYTVLSAAVIGFGPQPAVVNAQDKDALEALTKSVQALTKQVKALEDKSVDKDAVAEAMRAELKKLENGPLADLDKNIKFLKGEMATLQTNQLKQKRELDDLKDQIEVINKKLIAGVGGSPSVDKAYMEEFRKALQEIAAKMTPADKRFYPPTNGNGSTAGKIMLVNHYSEELLFIINGVGHRVSPTSSKLVVDVPVGSVGVEVFSSRWGVFNRQSTKLAAGDTFTLTATPR